MLTVEQETEACGRNVRSHEQGQQHHDQHHHGHDLPGDALLKVGVAVVVLLLRQPDGQRLDQDVENRRDDRRDAAEQGAHDVVHRVLHAVRVVVGFRDVIRAVARHANRGGALVDQRVWIHTHGVRISNCLCLLRHDRVLQCRRRRRERV